MALKFMPFGGLFATRPLKSSWAVGGRGRPDLLSILGYTACMFSSYGPRMATFDS